MIIPLSQVGKNLEIITRSEQLKDKGKIHKNYSDKYKKIEVSMKKTQDENQIEVIKNTKTRLGEENKRFIIDLKA